MNIILSTPNDALNDGFFQNLTSVLETGLVSVVLVRKTGFDLKTYKALVNKIVPVAQKYECAVLLDNYPDLVRELDADGTQITTGHKDVISAINTLKPDFIVGAANQTTRHEAMLCGEAGADYLAFGDFERTPDDASLALAHWWSKLFEIPCAVFDPDTQITAITPGTEEFLGLCDNIWLSENKPGEEIRNLQKAPNACYE